MRGGGVRALGGLPLRAMPQGELLDTAVVLLRSRILPLLLTAAPLLAAEQGVLWFAGARWLDSAARFTDWWSTIAALVACETVIVGLLGGYAGAAVVPALLGRKVAAKALFRRARLLPALAVVALLAVPAWAGAYFGLIGWAAVYGFFGLAAPALVVDRSKWPFGAMGRSAALTARLGWRAVWIRLWAYAIWLGIRAALALGPILLLWQLGLAPTAWFGSWQVLTVWGLAGTVSCAALACLDAVLLVDTRIRAEGLDIRLRRAVAHGVDPAQALAYSRPRHRPSAPGPIQPFHPPVPPPAPPPVPPVRTQPLPPMSHQARMQMFQAEAQARAEEFRRRDA